MNDLEFAQAMFSEEVTTASWSFFTWKSIRNLAAGDAELVDALNDTALSWRIIQRSLQTEFFITMGRMFDKDPRSLTAMKLLDLCANNLDQFSKAALKERKLRDQQDGEPDWLEGYLENAYEPTADDFENLKGEVLRYQDIYEATYQPIRHKLLAHKDLNMFEKRHELFENTDIGEILDILSFLFQIENIVWQLLFDGRLRAVGYFEYNEEERVDGNVRVLLTKLTS
jgi:hypothetical protein